MKNKEKNIFDNLTQNAIDFIKLVVKKMRYRKKVRVDVQAELTAHFEDALKDCKTDEQKEKTTQKLIEDFGDVKLLAALLRRAKKRCRPLWRTIVARTFQTIGVLIICFIFYCVYISLGSPTISTNYVEQATNFVRPAADESQNAAVLYQKAIDNYKKPPLVETESLLRIIADKQWISELSEKEISLLRQWLTDNGEAIEYLKQGSQRPYCWWDRGTEIENDYILNVLMPELSPMRGLVRMTAWQAKLNAYDGKIDEGFDDLFVCYRVGMHFKGPRILLEQLVGIATQALVEKNALIIVKNNSLDSQTLKSIQNRFEELVNKDNFIINYEVESFLAFDFIQRCYTDDGRGSGHLIPRKIKEFNKMIWQYEVNQNKDLVYKLVDYTQRLAMAVGGANRRRMRQTWDEMYNKAQKSAYKSPRQLKEQDINFEQDFGNWSFMKKARFWPISMLMPATVSIRRFSFQLKTDLQGLITILAVLRYNQDKGHYPENLNKLIETSYLKELPIDLYSDKPLVYKKTDEGFMLYSLGPDFEDDGGKAFVIKKGRISQRPSYGDADAILWPIQKK